MPVNNMHESGRWNFREEPSRVQMLLKFGIITPQEARQFEKDFTESMKWGQTGAIAVPEGVTVEPITPEVEVVYNDNIKYLTLRTPETHGVRNIDLVFPDEEITNIMDGTGRIVRQIRHSAMEQEKLYHEALNALRNYEAPPPFEPDLHMIDVVNAGLDDLQDPEPLQFEAPEFDYVGGKKPKLGRRGYVLYETADSIAEKWNDESLIGYCEYCGMDDSPIVIPRKDNSDTKAKCKWCAELDNLTWHIKYNGGAGYSAYKEPIVWSKLPWIQIAYCIAAVSFSLMMVFSAMRLISISPSAIIGLGSILAGLGVINGKRHGGPVD